MKTSKEHYQGIAQIIRANYDVSNKPVKFALRDMTDQLAQLFEQENPAFNRHQFVAEACSVKALMGTV